MRTVLAALILAALTTVAHAQPAAAPTYSVGDTWTFTNRQVTVVKIDGDTTVMQGVNPICPTCLYYLDKNVTLLKVEQDDGKAPDSAKFPFLPVGPGWRFLDFPLELKKEWRISAPAFQRGQARNYVVDVQVQAYEDVKTKAGTFKAFKIWRQWQIVGRFSGEDARWNDTVWFAPEAKTSVKFTSTNRFATEWELVSYTLK